MSDAEKYQAEKYAAFEEALRKLLNTHCMESGSNTPDFVLAAYLVQCLIAFDRATRAIEEWYTA